MTEPAVQAPQIQDRPCASRVQRLRMIRAAISDSVGTDVARVGSMLEHSLGGGKGLRALVAHISCDWCGLVREQCNEVAAAMEMIHLAALIHDDIIDEATKRRDRSSVNYEFGNDAAVLAGDFLYSRASQMLCRLGNVRLLAEIADATNSLAEGEVMQLQNKERIPTREEYFDTIRRKTAALFSACALSGPVATGADGMVEPMRSFGYELGMAFQVTDDCIDYTGVESDTGKKPGMDFFEGKATLPLIVGMESAGKKDRSALEKLRRNRELEGSFEKAREILERIGAIDRARSAARDKAEVALSELALLPESDFSLMLRTLVEKCVDRVK